MSNDMNYVNYLGLEKVLNAQRMRSNETDKPAHDEHLFIIVHQTYELWFKQILFELDSILAIFKADHVNEEDMGKVVARAHRINSIFHVIIQHIDVLETMTPLDFLEFRDLIYKASGFQSTQFRLLENKLGLKSTQRVSMGDHPYSEHIHASDKAKVVATETEKSLFDCIDSWLSRTPFLSTDSFKFWDHYKLHANIMFQKDIEFIKNNSTLSEKDKSHLMAQIDSTLKLFDGLFDEKLFNEARKNGEWRFSFRALHAALLIQVYRDKPAFQLPFRLLTEILNLDSHLTQWRYRHVIMVKRMLGVRIGSGGSTGAHYLQQSADKHKIFDDLYKLTSFFIPRSKLPDLPEEFNKKLGFSF
jgi:tryptophan 2,3-dioxygenase